METLHLIYCILTIQVAINHCCYTKYEKYLSVNKLKPNKTFRIITIIANITWFIVSLLMLMILTFY